MKVRLNRVELGEALGAVCSVATARSPKPILQCALLQALKDHCWLIATDLEIGIRMTLSQVEVAQEGRVLVSADKLAQIVRECTDDVLEMEADESVCHVRGRGAHFQIYCQDPSEFPPVAEVPEAVDFELAAADLKRLSEWTVFAAARESTRYAINGVLWDKRGSTLTMVATDGRRLSRAAGSTEGGDGGDVRAIVPGKTMQLLQRVMGEGEGPIGVKITENQIIAAFLSFAGLLFFYLLGDVTSSREGLLGQVSAALSIRRHSLAFSNGVIELRDVFYFLAFTAFFLFLSLESLKTRIWRS